MADTPEAARASGAAAGPWPVGLEKLGPGAPGAVLLFQIARRLGRDLDRRLAELDLTAQQAGLLLIVADHPTRPSQLSEPLGTDPAGMTRLLDTLERKGLARRAQHPSDRRSVVIELTPQGRALVPRVVPVVAKAIAQLFAGFSGAEITRVEDALARLLANLEPRSADGQRER